MECICRSEGEVVVRLSYFDLFLILDLPSLISCKCSRFIAQETHTLCVFDRLPVVSWRRAKYKQMYGLKSTLTVSR